MLLPIGFGNNDRNSGAAIRCWCCCGRRRARRLSEGSIYSGCILGRLRLRCVVDSLLVVFVVFCCGSGKAPLITIIISFSLLRHRHDES